jgi:thymidylate kinase
VTKLICVTGADGAGKTTQLARLAERLENGRKKKVAVVTVWDLLFDPLTQDLIAFDEPKQVDKYLKVLGSTSRALFMFHCLHQALDLAVRKKPDVILVNSYWYKYYAPAVAHGGDPATLRRITSVFPTPDQTFFLRVTPEEASKRKAALSGYETGFADPRTKEAFVAFQRPAHTALDALSKELGWVELDGHASAADQTKRLLDAVAV